MKVIVILVLALATGQASVSWACSCMRHSGALEDRVRDAYSQASSVVFAEAVTVINLESSVSEFWSEEKGKHEMTGHAWQQTQFRSLETWKGDHGEEFSTMVRIECCLCGYRFNEGQRYLLFLYGPNQDGYYGTSTCSRSKRESEGIEHEVNILNQISNSR